MAVAGAGGGKGAVELNVRLHRLAAQQVAGHPAHAGGACGMGAGRPHHDGAHDIKDVQTAFRLCKRVSVWGRPAPPRVRRTSVFDLHKSKTLVQSGIHFRCANNITGSPAALAAGAGPTMMGPMISKMFKNIPPFQ